MIRFVKLFEFKRLLIVLTVLMCLISGLCACQKEIQQPVAETTAPEVQDSTEEPPVEPTVSPLDEITTDEAKPYTLSMYQVTNETIDQYHPQWSPDGKTLGFVANENGQSEIWLLNEGNEEAVLFPLDLNGDFAFSWSSDGSQIVFDAYDSRDVLSVWLMDYPTGTPSQISPKGNGVAQPDWSPDDQQIIYQTMGDLFILEIETGEVIVFEESPSIEWLPQWSPDGNAILFTSIRSGNADLWVKSVDSDETFQLTTNESYDDRGVWSPDGEFIAFVSDRAGNEDIWIYEVSTGNLTQVTSHEAVDSMPAWSPDGQSLVFASERSGNMDIWSVDISSITGN